MPQFGGDSFERKQLKDDGRLFVSDTNDESLVGFLENIVTLKIGMPMLFNGFGDLRSFFTIEKVRSNKS
jgi:hypothetical protein